jgi:hypothetical protein
MQNTSVIDLVLLVGFLVAFPPAFAAVCTRLGKRPRAKASLPLKEAKVVRG